MVESSNSTEIVDAAVQDGRRRSRQVFSNGEVHQWYRIVLGYSDQVVSYLLKRFGLGADDRVIDCFCGTGTTLVECMKNGIASVGVDANPASCFAAKVKTDWGMNSSTLLENLTRIQQGAKAYLDDEAVLEEDPTYRYLASSGMIKRGWISPKPLRRAVAIKRSISRLRTTSRYQNALMLALISQVVESTSNVKFGPELYCGPRKRDAGVLRGFSSRVRTMASDLDLAPRPCPHTEVHLGDARDVGDVINREVRFSAAITSPPYPAEHDYTRNSRLELAFLEAVTDRDSLQRIKRRMIRCHTKGIYKGESDAGIETGCERIDSIVDELDRLTARKTHKFAPLYSTVVREYFGGMRRHLAALFPLLADGAPYALVVGDQAGYVQVHIPTADILSEIAERVGYQIEDIMCWRKGRQVGGRRLDEKILIIRKPRRKHESASN